MLLVQSVHYPHAHNNTGVDFQKKTCRFVLDVEGGEGWPTTPIKPLFFVTENLTTTSNGTRISRDQDQEGTTQACTNSAKEVVLIAGQMMEHSAKG